MGWIFGALGPRTDADEAALRAAHPAPRHDVRTPRLLLAAGGIAATCRAGTFAPGVGGTFDGWLVVGLGLEPHGDGLRALDDAAWAARLAPAGPDLGGLGGHFVALRHGPGRVELFTDALGLRTAHVARAGERVVFGTALAAVARAAGADTPDVEALGPHWTAFNAFTARSLVRGVERLGPGGRAVLTPGRADVEDGPAWTPEGADAGFVEAVGRGLRLEGARPSLGLSGGLDSRFLLALAQGGARPVALHTFGPAADPDVALAHRAARVVAWPLRHVAPAEADADAWWAALGAYAAEVCATTPASAVARLGHFGALHADGLAVVDGGFGELGRRQFLNRLRHARVPLRADAAPDVLPFVAVHRADVFAPDVAARMRAGAEAELARALAALPPGRREDVLDVFAVRTRLPHFFGYEQARLDARAVAYMPFAQPDAVAAVFALPLRLRRNGRLVRRTIRSAAPALARLPLVKGGGTYPFRLGTAGAHLYTKLRGRFVPPYADPLRARFLRLLEPRVRALAASEGVRTCGLYDPARVRALVDAYYAGDAARGGPLDWWLAFEAWRRGLRGEE